jgi:hypothetical protein
MTSLWADLRYALRQLRKSARLYGNALALCLNPAQRTESVDPMQALRSE